MVNKTWKIGQYVGYCLFLPNIISGSVNHGHGKIILYNLESIHQRILDTISIVSLKDRAEIEMLMKTLSVNVLLFCLQLIA